LALTSISPPPREGINLGAEFDPIRDVVSKKENLTVGLPARVFKVEDGMIALGAARTVTSSGPRTGGKAHRGARARKNQAVAFDASCR